jgi:hypothetical protein
MQVIVGADPEVFVMEKGRPICAHDLVPGTKSKPFPVDRGAVQVDGMALEFNISPAATAQEFMGNVSTVLATLREMCPDKELVAVSDVTFDEEEFNSAPDEAKILGCDPDFNAWTGFPNKIDPEAPLRRLRTAAGHVHVGWSENEDVTNPAHFQACVQLAKQMDVYLGMPARAIEGNDGFRRRQLYGAAGAFRPKPYGMEYRVLSNFWLRHPAYMEWVFNSTQLAVSALCSNIHAYGFPSLSYFPREIINGWEIPSERVHRRVDTLNSLIPDPYKIVMAPEVRDDNK